MEVIFVVEEEGISNHLESGSFYAITWPKPRLEAWEQVVLIDVFRWICLVVRLSDKMR